MNVRAGLPCVGASLFAFVISVGAVPEAALAQSAVATAPAALTSDDYARAERFLATTVNPLVVGGTVNAAWLADDRFTYRSKLADGASEFLLVDPVKKSRVPAFDHERLAAALATASGTAVDATQLPFQTIELSADGASVSFDVAATRYRCDVAGTACATVARDANAVASPDGTREVFIKDWNLWVRDIASAVERPLTTDGVEHFGYATDNAGWKQSDRPIVLWSPDSKKVATFQQDERKVGEMYLVETRAGHPVLKAWKYPLPGDEVVAMLHRVVIDADSGAVVRFKMAPDYHRAMLGDDVSRERHDLEPGRGATRVRLDRPRPQDRHRPRGRHRHRRRAHGVRGVGEDALRVAGRLAGAVGHRTRSLWNSQRDDWSHLYLYDLATGRLKNQITSGHGPVTRSSASTRRRARCSSRANGREAGQDPVLRAPLSHRPRRQGLRLADARRRPPRRADRPRPAATWSTATRRPTGARGRAARRRRRRLVMPLEKADISKLVAAGWKPPMRFSVKARDGKTDLYGLLFRPTIFDATKKYPIINQAYPGPQSGSVGSRVVRRRARRPAGARRARLRRRDASTAWARRAARSRSTTPTTARWAATTRCPIRWPA